MGVLTWDIGCAGADGPFILQVPLMLDEPGARGRAKRDVPRLNVENIRSLRGAGADALPRSSAKNFSRWRVTCRRRCSAALPEGTTR